MSDGLLMRKRQKQRSFLLLLSLLALSLPVLFSPFYLILSIQILYLTILVMSFSFMASQKGLLSLAQVSFFGIAGYSVGILGVKSGWLFPYPHLIGLASATLAAAILGLIAIRVRAIPFLMMTLAFGEIVYGTARHWSALTNGDNGINGIPAIEFAGIGIKGAAQPVRFYYLALAVFVLCYWLLNKINRSSFGLAHQASKQSPKRLEALGYPVFWTKYTAFVICGFFAGVSGVLAAIFERVMHPESIWFGAIMFMLISAILGGINSRIGPLVGVTVAVILERNLEPVTEHYRIVVGVIFLITILLVRQGIMGFIETTRVYKKFLHITGFD